jgi:ketosteroid isomerase-like protein
MQSNQSGFASLLDRLAAAWEGVETDLGVACFTDDAIYMQPPDVQLFRGADELRRFFGALEPGTIMTWHRRWFDVESQAGIGEFTFGEMASDRADHGIAVIELRDGRIARWTEYLQQGPLSRDEFLRIEGKTWRWHGGNYPTPAPGLPLSEVLQELRDEETA